MPKLIIPFLVASCALFGQNVEQMNSRTKVKFLPLGDSYTICEGAQWKESWPYLLTENVKKAGIDIELLGNPSVTGYTTDQLIEEELPLFDQLKPNFVTLLIGVNDYVRGRTKKEFSLKLRKILDHVQEHLPDKSKVILITIPDYSVTPGGAQYAQGRDVNKGIAEFNDMIRSEADERQLPLVDIFPSTLKMKDNPSLIASDGLHPSAKEYANWEVMIREVAFRMWK